MVPRENKDNAYPTLGGTNKEYYCIFHFSQYSQLCSVTDIMKTGLPNMGLISGDACQR